MEEAGGLAVETGGLGASVVDSGHQVSLKVTTLSMVTVAVETKAGETCAVHAVLSSQWVMVTKVVWFLVAVAVVTLA